MFVWNDRYINRRSTRVLSNHNYRYFLSGGSVSITYIKNTTQEEKDIIAFTRSKNIKSQNTNTID